MLLGNDPLATTPLAAAGGGSVSVMLFDDTFAQATVLYGYPAHVTADAFAMATTPNRTAAALFGITDELAYTDLLYFAQYVLVTESFATTDDITGSVARLMALTESLVLTGLVTGYRAALGVIADAIALSDEASGVWVDIISNTFSMTDTVPADITADLLESLVATTTYTNSVSFVMVYDDSLAYTDDLSSIRAALMNLSDNLVLGGVYKIADTVYDAWVLNTETLGAWQYTNFPFNSFATINGRQFGMKEDGLYELTGDDDDGTNISASLKTGLLDFGSTLQKRVPRAYIGYTADGKLLFKTIETNGGEKIERWYELKEQTADAIKSTRIKLGRGAKARYWQFEIDNLNGSDFTLSDLRMFPMILRRRV